MTRFTPSSGAVYLGRARLSDELVEQLFRLFAKNRAWDLCDQLQAARDEASQPSGLRDQLSASLAEIGSTS